MRKERNVSIDLLRIMACFMVLGVHVGQVVGTDNYTSIGAKGVQLFFIISGFLAMQTCEKLSIEANWTVKYYKGRLRKIISIYYWCLCINYIYTFLNSYFVMNESLKDIFVNASAPCGINYLRYFFFLQGFLPSDNYALWNNRFALWTMSSFAFFYVFVPFIYKKINNYIKALISILLLFVMKKYMEVTLLNLFEMFGQFDQMEHFVMIHPLCNVCFFMLGVFVWHIKASNLKNVVVMTLLSFNVLTQMKFWGYELLFTVLLIIATSDSINDHISEKVYKIITYLSEISFCVYLSHPVILDICKRIGWYLGIINWKAFPFMFSICLIGAWINYVVFNKFCIFCKTIKQK